MGRNGRVVIDELEDFKKDLQKNLSGQQLDLFIESCAKELAARLLAKVIKRTPVGDYSGDTYTCAMKKTHKGVYIPGKVGGTLRRGWTGGKVQDAKEFARSLNVFHSGNSYVIEVVNPVEYASYVEHGHRQTPGRYVPILGVRLTQGWVEGHHMLSISEEEIQRDAPRVLENKLKKKLGECFK